jgi:PAT family beta-lactamase induction signal transducer AmpG
MARFDFQKLFNRQTLIILMMGIASGLPLALTGGTLQAWMKTESVDLGTIGLFAFVGLPYTLKFLWAPLMDRFPLTKHGRRRSWMLVTQLLLIASVLLLSASDPKENLPWVALTALLVSFFSASQDIVIDAWRREALTDQELGWGSSVHVAAYLFAFRLVSGSMALILADHLPWSTVYQIMAAVLGLGLIATLLCREPAIEGVAPKTLREVVLDPFIDFFAKPSAFLILLFILLYKIGDNMALQMTTPFFLDIGFTKTELGVVTKAVGWVALSIGGLIGGGLLLRLSITRALFWFGVIQAVAILGFAGMAVVGKNMSALIAVIAFENVAIGMGTSAFTAFMATLTNKRFTATQYALLSSFMGVPRIFAAAPTGFLAEKLGWTGFFLLCTLAALPGLLLIRPLQKKQVT